MTSIKQRMNCVDFVLFLFYQLAWENEFLMISVNPYDSFRDHPQLLEVAISRLHHYNTTKSVSLLHRKVKEVVKNV